MKLLLNKEKFCSSAFITLAFFLPVYVGYSLAIQDNKWELISVNGLQKKYEHFNQMVFVNERLGFLGGSCISDTSAQKRNNIKNNYAIIYKTADGGKTWVKHVFQKGSIESIEAEPRTIYALKRIYTENSLNRLRSSFIKSNNHGETLEEIYTTELPFHILKLIFSDSVNGIAIFQNQNDRSLVSNIFPIGGHQTKSP